MPSPVDEVLSRRDAMGSYKAELSPECGSRIPTGATFPFIVFAILRFRIFPLGTHQNYMWPAKAQQPHWGVRVVSIHFAYPSASAASMAKIDAHGEISVDIVRIGSAGTSFSADWEISIRD